jgi:hypothetical protein
MLSPYCSRLLEDLHLGGSKVRKLVPNLMPKKGYVVHYRNLKLYLSLGMQLTKVHRVMGFKQSTWLKPYIDFNTEKRKAAKNEFEKDFWKLMNNSVFGKTMENLRKRVDVKLVNSDKRLRKLACQPSFKAFKIFNEDLAAVHMRKRKLCLNRPIYVGFSILDMSKVLMYNFHYGYIQTKYEDRAKLLFTDTDSLCYIIQTDDVYADMQDDIEWFDTSDYPKDHPIYSITNKKVLGKMKDEAASVPPEEFVGLKSKMYSLLAGKQAKKTAKRVVKSAIRDLHHESYLHTLFAEEILMAEMPVIRAEKHELYTMTINKIGLSPYDDKRYILEDGISSYAYGHYKIQELGLQNP